MILLEIIVMMQETNAHTNEAGEASTMADETFVNVSEAGRCLNVSVSTVWRMIRRGSLPSVRRGGHRLIPRQALHAQALTRQETQIPALREDHPIFRLVGAGRSGGSKPGARDKHAIVDQ